MPETTKTNIGGEDCTNDHVASKTTIFRRRPVEKYCSLAHVATNRIFDTFKISGTPDKNRVADVVANLIDHAREFKHG